MQGRGHCPIDKPGNSGWDMRSIWRKITSVLAIYAVALHVILLGLAPIAVAADSADPVAVICHSVAPGDAAPGQPGLNPGHACEHCNLCGIAAPPEPGLAPSATLLPSRLLGILSPLPQRPRAGIAFSANLARGPPSLA